MATLTVPSVGKALIFVHKAQMHAETKYLKMQNCKSCSKGEAKQWKDAAEFFADIKKQLQEQIEV